MLRGEDKNGMRPSGTLASLLLFGGSLGLAVLTPWQHARAARPDQPVPDAVAQAAPDRLALAGAPWPSGLPDSLPALEQERAALQERLAQIGLTIDRILAGVVMTARKADPWGPARESDPAPLLEALGQERQLILDRLGQVDRKSLLLAAASAQAADRPAPRDPDADLLSGPDPATEETESPEELMARVDRFDAAMERLLARIESPPDSPERGGASGEELLRRLYAMRDAQARLLERIARIETASAIPLPPPAPPGEQVAAAAPEEGPAPASGSEMAEAAPTAETRMAETRMAETPLLETPMMEMPVAEPPAQAPVIPQILVAGPAVPALPPIQASPPVPAIAPPVPLALPVREGAMAAREARLTPALRCRMLLQRAQLGEELTPAERRDLRGACVT
jgi:hypothetical protein